MQKEIKKLQWDEQDQERLKQLDEMERYKELTEALELPPPLTEGEEK